MRNNECKVEFKRGGVYLANLPESKGSVEKGRRPIVIVSNEKGNTYSPNVIVCPLTTKTGKRNLPTHVKLTTSDGVKIESDLLAENIMTISKEDLSPYCLCELSERAMNKIDKALEISLELNRKKELREKALRDFADAIKHNSENKKELIDIFNFMCSINEKDSKFFGMA